MQLIEIPREAKINCTYWQASCHHAKVVARPPTDHTRISSPDFGSNRPTKSRSSLHHLCLTSRDFVPWRFLDAGQWSVRSLFVAGVQKPSQKATLLSRFDE